MFNDLKLHKILEYSFLGIFFLYIIGGAILRAIIEAKFGVIIMLHFHVPLALLLTVEAILFFATAFTKYLDDQKQPDAQNELKQDIINTKNETQSSEHKEQDIINTANKPQQSKHKEQDANANEDDTEVLLNQKYTSGKHGD
ncbi:MAG: hypothetical protein HON55_00550 [Legionellales bacterium]|jgi:hypothetical protein|nr:hypothetical protein [Legionellales bacterium]